MAEIRLVKTSAHKIESSEEQRLKLGDIVKEGGDTKYQSSHKESQPRTAPQTQSNQRITVW